MIDPNVYAYPLHWPDNQQRTPPQKRSDSPFRVDYARSRRDLLAELRRLGAAGVVISCNVRPRNVELGSAATVNDCGVAVYFNRNDRPHAIACDTYYSVAANIRAIGTTVAALRTIERHGSTQLLDRAIMGFAALPAHEEVKPWWEVLGVTPDADADQIKTAFREKARLNHPDRTGNDAAYSQITAAYEQAQKALGFQ